MLNVLLIVKEINVIKKQVYAQLAKEDFGEQTISVDSHVTLHVPRNVICKLVNANGEIVKKWVLIVSITKVAKNLVNVWVHVFLVSGVRSVINPVMLLVIRKLAIKKMELVLHAKKDQVNGVKIVHGNVSKTVKILIVLLVKVSVNQVVRRAGQECNVKNLYRVKRENLDQIVINLVTKAVKMVNVQKQMELVNVK